MTARRTALWTLFVGLLLVTFLAVAPTPATASNLFLCQGCSAPPSAPTLLTNVNSITVGVAGSFTLQNPLLIVVGVFNGNGTPSISYSGCATPSACPLATVPTYGLTANSGVSFTSSSGGTAFSALGLSAGGSQSFVNWANLDLTYGFGTPTSFTLYAFALNTNLTSGSPITIDESGAALGSYIIGYSCKNGTGSSSGCASNGDRADTPFTTSGIVGATATEPGSLALLGLVLLGFIGLGLRKHAWDS
ncbi:MAG: hypothetical protein ACRD3D_16875 [Terriglobia bacterium]